MGFFSKLFGKRNAVSPQQHSDADVAKLDMPWARAGRAYDDTYLRLIAQVSNWRIAFFIMAIITGVAVSGIVYIGSLPKFIPMTIEVDKLGRTVAVRALTGEPAITDPKRLAYREMFELIENLRTVTTDRAANNANIHKAFVRLSGAAKTYALTELRKAPPNEVGSTKTVQVEVRSALPISDKTWQVEWVERSYSLNGLEIKTENWKASLQYELRPSGNEQDIRENPIGFTTTDLNWMKVI